MLHSEAFGAPNALVTNANQGRPSMSDERETEARPRAHELVSVPALRITVDGAEAAVLVSSAEPMRVHVGTSPLANLRVEDPTVSRRHLAIEPAGPSFRVVDLQSKNGTLLNGVPIVEAFVRPGDTLQIGATTLRVASAEAPSSPTVSAMRFGKILGASDAMRRLYIACERLAVSKVPLLIEGERGTGKETLAESLHEQSGRAGAFLVLDCGAGDAKRLGVELFGDATGPGLFERASGGTLLLDEVDELPRELHQKAARAIDKGEVVRLGTSDIRKADVRVVATTRRDLDRLVVDGRFDETLLTVLAATRMNLPPLRRRDGDIRLLSRHFAESLGYAPLDDATLGSFESYDWPSNVTELKAAVLRHVTLGELAETTSEPGKITSSPNGDWLEGLLAARKPFSVARRVALSEFERRYVERLLQDNDGNVARAAAASGIALRHFQRVKSKHKER